MNKKIIILFSLFSIILIGCIIFFCMNLKEFINDSNLETCSINTENNNFSNIIENVVTEVTNDVIENNVIQNDIAENNVKSNIITEVTSTSTTSSKSNTKPNSSNITTSKNTTSVATKPVINTKDNNKTDTKVNTENNITKNETITNEKQNTSSTDTSKDITKKEDTTINIGNPELAYTTYRVTNTAIIPEIINILNSEIAKDKELVDFGTKAISSNKTNAYNNTSGFTYLFVKDITKGKIAGNYQSFPERVRNTVGAFGTYYVYAEDEYTYNGQGLDPKWSQTLVWIYVNF